MRRPSLVAAVGSAGIALSLAGAGALAKGRAADRIPREVLTIGISGSRLVVTDAVRFAFPLTRATDLPMFSGAEDLSGAGYVRQTPTVAVVPQGATGATLRYALPLPSQGLSTVWRQPLPIAAFWLRTGPGVDLPIELNQAFYPEGAAAGGSTDAPLSLARNLPAGPMRLNLEFTPPPPSAFIEGFLEILAFVVVGLGWMWWARRPRRQGLEPEEGGGGDG